MSNPNIDLILPVFNPPTAWAAETMNRKQSFEEKLGSPVQLIVVNDGSTDMTAFDALVKLDPTIRVLHQNRNQGKGAALRTGIRASRAPRLLFTDADFPYEVDGMVDIVRSLEAGANVALGHRQQDYYASVPWFRQGMSEFFRFVLRRLLKFPVTDTQCGLKGMDEKGKAVFVTTTIDRFLVDMEFIKKASQEKGLVIEPVVVQLRKDVRFSRMGVGTIIREGLNFFKVIFS